MSYKSESHESFFNNDRDTNFFTKFFYKLLMWWVIIGSDVNNGPRWKPIRSWIHQQFEKCCKIVCGCSITHHFYPFMSYSNRVMLGLYKMTQLFPNLPHGELWVVEM